MMCPGGHTAIRKKMKITDIKTFIVNKGGSKPWGTGNNNNYIFVKVYTDDGVEGLGEAFHSLDEPIEAAVRKYARSLIGKDPTRVIRNYAIIYRGLRYPLGTAELSALSAVEHALWDISGKVHGLPVYKMLGGPFRDKIRLYSGCSGHMPVKGAAPATLVDRVRQVVDRGFSALKFSPQPEEYGSISDQEILRQSVKRVKSVREAVGDSIDICLDYHGRSFSPVEAVKLARALEPYNIFFLEEPALAESPRSILEAKEKTIIPIAAGERCVTRGNMRDVIAMGAVHIIQPEPTANGGILETFKLAAMAELYHIVVAPHQACSPVSLLVNCHIDAAIPNFIIQECNTYPYSDVLRDILSGLPVIKDGYLELPSKPGLGIELNEEAAVHYEYKPYDRPVIVKSDGSIGLE
jgi:galactonate dehydratase